MPTGDKKINLFAGRLLSKTALKERFLDFLDNQIDEAVNGIFQSTSGVLDADEIGVVADGNDRIKLDLALANRVVVGGGQIITIPDEVDVSKEVDVPNANPGPATDYEVGVRYAQIENDADINPKTGKPEYRTLEESLGEKAEPTSLVDTFGSNLRINIDSITEAGQIHTGRKVRVWLKTPVSGVQATAFFEADSIYSAGSNYVDIPYSGANGPLGQDTSADPPSTTAADYQVFIKGISAKTGTTISTDSTYALLGVYTGAGAGSPPSSPATTGQVAVFVITRQRAYDGSGSGAGRKIALADGALEVNTLSGTPGDDLNGQLRLDRIGTTDKMQFMLQLMSPGAAAIPLAILEPVSRATVLQASETVTKSSTQLATLARGGVDLLDVNMRLSERMHILQLTGGTVAEQGLYLIDTLATATFNVLDLQTGIAPAAWTAEDAPGRILVPRVIFANNAPSPANLDWWDGLVITLRDGTQGDTPIRVFSHGNSGDAVVLYDNANTPADLQTGVHPRKMLDVIPSDVGVANKWPFHFYRGARIDAGLMSGGSEPSAYSADALRLIGGGGGEDTVFPTMALAIESGSLTGAAGLGGYMGGLNSENVRKKGHHFRDDFLYNEAAFATDPPAHYELITINGGGTIAILAGATGRGGVVELATVATSTAGRRLEGGHALGIDSDIYSWRWQALVRVDSIADITAYAGLKDGPTGGVDYSVAHFKFESGINGGRWELIHGDGTGSPATVDTAHAAVVADRWYLLSVQQLGDASLGWSIADSAGAYSSDVIGSFSPGYNGVAGAWRPYVQVVTKAAAAKALELNHWEWQDVRQPIQGILLDV